MLNRIQLVGFPNTGKTTLLNELTRLNKPTSKIPGTTLFITENHYKKNIMYDMPGLYSQQNMYNLISKPNLQSLLAWNKLYSPPVLLHQAFFFGGKVEIKDVRIILFGLGGACASDNRWFVLNYKEFWKGLPPLNELSITKYEFDLAF
jgi:ribosome biogenesis GTPase A